MMIIMNKRNRPIHTSIVTSILLAVLSALLLAASRRVPGFAQWYSATVYPVIVSALGIASGKLPFSLAEMLCAAAGVLVITGALVTVIRTVRSSHSKLTPLASFIRHILLFAAVLLFLYSANCGVNYYRDSFVPEEVYEEAEFTDDDLFAFCEYTAEKLQECYRSDDDGIPAYPGKKELREMAVAAMENLSKDYPELSGNYPAPKYLTYMSRFFSSMGVSGIYSPFTVEANVNGEMPGMEMPFTSCHELSHLRGFMNEGEANYIGWLACINSTEPSFRRSGWLIAWDYAGSALRKADEERFYSIYEKLPDKAVRELEDNYLFWNEHETQASEVQNKVNDAYLRSNGQANGILTYGQLTGLMIMWYIESGSGQL